MPMLTSPTRLTYSLCGAVVGSDRWGNTVLVRETAFISTTVLDDFVPITVTNGTLYINGSPISEGTDDQTLSLSDTTLSIDG